MFREDPILRLYRGDTFLLGKGRARLLELIEEENSINSAARELGMSYRHAWAILRKISESLGEDVVCSERGGSGGGGGTVLTEPGKALLQEYRSREEGIENYVRYGRKPELTVDGVVFRKECSLEKPEILLIKRGNPPFQGMFALPGGFVDYGEKVEDAAVRELEEETGLRTRVISLVGVYSDPARDPRGHTVSPVFLLEIIGGELKAGDDAAEASFFPVGELPELAFDHAGIVKEALRMIRDMDGP